MASKIRSILATDTLPDSSALRGTKPQLTTVRSNASRSGSYSLSNGQLMKTDRRGSSAGIPPRAVASDTSAPSAMVVFGFFVSLQQTHDESSENGDGEEVRRNTDDLFRRADLERMLLLVRGSLIAHFLVQGDQREARQESRNRLGAFLLDVEVPRVLKLGAGLLLFTEAPEQLAEIASNPRQPALKLRMLGQNVRRCGEFRQCIALLSESLQYVSQLDMQFSEFPRIGSSLTFVLDART